MSGKGPGKTAKQKLKMAIAIWGKNRHYEWNKIRGRHFLQTANDCGIQEAEQTIAELKNLTPEAIKTTRARLPKGFPETVSQSVLSGLQEAADLL